MRRTHAVVLSAATIVAALGVGGCGGDPVTADSSASATTGPVSTTVAAPPAAAPLPPADDLTAVLYRMADTSVPAEQKIGLLEYGNADDVPVLKNFGEALAANGFVPLSVTATELQWTGQQGDVVATVTFAPLDGQAEASAQAFTFPMEFNPMRGGWQLSRRSAEQLLPVVAETRPTPPG